MAHGNLEVLPLSKDAFIHLPPSPSCSVKDARERQNLLIFDMSRAKGGAINLIAQQFGPDVGCIRWAWH